jgi:hypothetical protein
MAEESYDNIIQTYMDARHAKSYALRREEIQNDTPVSSLCTDSETPERATVQPRDLADTIK